MDEYTRETLDVPLTQDAIINDLAYFNDRVWEFMSADEATETFPGGKILGGRWVMSNKGDAVAPKIRCRYAAAEVIHGHDLAFYAHHATARINKTSCCTNGHASSP